MFKHWNPKPLTKSKDDLEEGTNLSCANQNLYLREFGIEIKLV